MKVCKIRGGDVLRLQQVLLGDEDQSEKWQFISWKDSDCMTWFSLVGIVRLQQAPVTESVVRGVPLYGIGGQKTWLRFLKLLITCVLWAMSHYHWNFRHGLFDGFEALNEKVRYARDPLASRQNILRKNSSLAKKMSQSFWPKMFTESFKVLLNWIWLSEFQLFLQIYQSCYSATKLRCALKCFLY